MSEPSEQAKAFTEARAQLQWGSSAARVREMLGRAGIDHAAIRSFMTQALMERSQARLKDGLLRVLCASAPLGFAAYGLHWWPDNASIWGPIALMMPLFFGARLLFSGIQLVFSSFEKD